MAIVQTNNKGRVAFPKQANTNVRAGYSTSFSVIYQASPYARLGILTGKSWQIEGQYTWFEIVTPDNKLGWVRRDVFVVDLSKPIEPVPVVSNTPVATSSTPAQNTAPAAPQPYTGPEHIAPPPAKNNGLDMALIGLGAIAAYKLFGGKKRKGKK